MGPQKPSSVGESTLPRRCFFCRGDALSTSAKERSSANLKSCAASLCVIFGLPSNHPFKVIYERAHYCADCLKQVQEADVTLGKLELLKQNLLRFQNMVYCKLGDNYFQIQNRDELKTTYDLFERGWTKAVKGKKFTYDEIVKVVYEKLDQTCYLNWERFSSEDKSSSTLKRSICTQTEEEIIFLQNRSPVHNEDSNSNCDDSGGNQTTANYGNAQKEYENTSNPADNSIIRNCEFDATVKGLHFTRASGNFEEKMYCDYDPENCKRFFYDNYNLQVHIKSFHLGISEPHECPVCLKGFIDEARLKHHYMRLHSYSSKFVCEQCGKGFATRTILNDHVRRKHIPGKTTFACGFCGAGFDNSEENAEHENLHRAKTHEQPFMCVYCDASFPNSNSLKTHYSRTHADNRYPCEICGKVLSSEFSLKIHQNIHTGAFKCSQCEFSGNCKASLNQHMLMHTNEKPYTCETCGKAFKYAKNLSSHQRAHTGVKPYLCKVCGEKFREASYLRRHEESHSNNANYACEQCGLGFKVKENLKKHARRHKEDYEPKKRIYKPRSDEQKEVRRLKREAIRKAQGLPLKKKRYRKSESIAKTVSKKSTVKKLTAGRKNMVLTKKVIEKTRKKNKSKKKAKKQVYRTISKDEIKSEEEFQEVRFMDSEQEIKEAVESIQEEQVETVLVQQGEFFEEAEVVYEVQTEQSHQIPIIIPVTVVGTVLTVTPPLPSHHVIVRSEFL